MPVPFIDHKKKIKKDEWIAAIKWLAPITLYRSYSQEVIKFFQIFAHTSNLSIERHINLSVHSIVKLIKTNAQYYAVRAALLSSVAWISPVSSSSLKFGQANHLFWQLFTHLCDTRGAKLNLFALLTFLWGPAPVPVWNCNRIGIWQLIWTHRHECHGIWAICE